MTSTDPFLLSYIQLTSTLRNYTKKNNLMSFASCIV